MQADTMLTHPGKRNEVVVELARTGRKTGLILLMQLLCALTLPFILAKPLTVGTPDFLDAANSHSFQIRSAIMVTFVGAALTLWLGIAVSQVLRHFNKPIALLFIIVCAISCAMDLLHAASITFMLSISNQFIKSGSVHSELYDTLAMMATAARRSVHIVQLTAIGAWILVFYASLFRFKLVPMPFAIAGLIGIACQFTGVTLMMLLGYRVIPELAMLLLPIQIVVGVWLIAKGWKIGVLRDTLGNV
jgi:hypothetical protein